MSSSKIPSLWKEPPPTYFEIFPFGTFNFEAPQWLHNFCVSWQGNGFTNCWNVFFVARQWDLLAVSCRWFEVICGEQYKSQVQHMFFQTQPVIKFIKRFQSRKCHSKTYCKFSAPNKLFKFWIQVWETAKETSSQTWLIPKINGDKLKDSYNLPGTHKGHCQTPLRLEPNPAVTIPDNKPYAL